MEDKPKEMQFEIYMMVGSSFRVDRNAYTALTMAIKHPAPGSQPFLVEVTDTNGTRHHVNPGYIVQVIEQEPPYVHASVI